MSSCVYERHSNGVPATSRRICRLHYNFGKTQQSTRQGSRRITLLNRVLSQYVVGGADQECSASDYAYTGRQWDGDAGLYYNRARWYDANSGRFISEDPQAFDGGDTNLYRYAGGDPIDHTDPTGYSWLSKAFHHLVIAVL